jgi:hypothetical protein
VLHFIKQKQCQLFQAVTKDEKNKLNQIKSPKKKRKKKPLNNKPPIKVIEKLCRRDIEELLGINRDTYTRVKGAVRRK